MYDIEKKQQQQPRGMRLVLRVLGRLLRFFVCLWLLRLLFFSIPFPYVTRHHRHHDDDAELTATAGILASYASSNWAQAIESAFLKVPNADSARAALQRITAETHIAGTDADYRSAIQVTSEWAQLLGADFSEDTHVFEAGSPESQHYITGDWKGPHGSPLFIKPRAFVDTYHVWLNYPINSSLSLTPPSSEDNPSPEPKWKAKLKEDAFPEDPTSDKGVPQFHGYSASGSVSGPIVYANQGSKQDFERLHSLGINTTGTIALVRYGDTFRGLKVRAAAEAGCVATIIYSDPAEDGNYTEANGYEPYPAGPARNPTSVQRGSVMALSLLAGDPSTPGKPSYKNATRLEPEESDTLAPIPSIPLSFEEAKVLFESLKGNGAAPDSKSLGKHWAGAIPGVEYWTGPTKDIAHLESYQDLQVRPIWNGYAIIPGFIDDEAIILGNHRDAWTFGAADPNSGTAAFHEIVAGLGALVKRGWRPLRTIVVASWDAEEYGLVGSTEFGEDFASWLSENAAIYHNLDVSVAGSVLGVGASPSLFDLFRQAAVGLPNPDKEGKNVTIEEEAPLGSGSDFTVFLQHLGIASSSVGYVGDGNSPVYHYHSNYDSFAWMDRFGDPGFKRHVSIAKLLGLVTLRSASDVFLPLNVTAYAHDLQAYLDKASEIVVKGGKGDVEGGAVDFEPLQRAVKEVKKAAKKWEGEKRKAEKKLAKLFHHHHSTSTAAAAGEDDDPTTAALFQKRGLGCGQMIRKIEHPHTPAAAHLAKHGGHHHHKSFFDKLRKLYKQIRSINKRAQAFERGFISHGGLEGREWYKHLGVAPGRWLGYGATTLPGLVEALSLDAGKGAGHEAKRLERKLVKIAEALRGEDEDED